jgi:hypothetical protein
LEKARPNAALHLVTSTQHAWSRSLRSFLIMRGAARSGCRKVGTVPKDANRNPKAVDIPHTIEGVTGQHGSQRIGQGMHLDESELALLATVRSLGQRFWTH